MLKLIKYNNKIKEKLDLTINDYKKYCETYSPIEIEIIPMKNGYGKFINIEEKEYGKYYHIYFNNDEKEILSDCINEGDNVKKIKIVMDYQIISFEKLFKHCKCIESINFKIFYRNNINNMNRMFSGCSYLKEINISNFNTIIMLLI